MRTRLISASVLLSALLVLTNAKVQADPPPMGPPGITMPRVFCFRVTDINRTPGDVTGNSFLFECEALNWTATAASGLFMAANPQTINPLGGLDRPVLSPLNTMIDPNGRGGPGGPTVPGPTNNIIGPPNRFDGDGLFPNPPLWPPVPPGPPAAIHSGRGRGDLPGLTNDWGVTLPTTATRVRYGTGPLGTPIPYRNLLGAAAAGQAQVNSMVPAGVDGRGDTAIDGGVGLNLNPGPIGMPFIDPVTVAAGLANGSGHSLDGFVLQVDNFKVGGTLSLNWFLLDAMGNPIGQSGFGSQMGFGVVNIARLPIWGPLPLGLWNGNTGFTSTSTDFFDTVQLLSNPAQFGLEFGGGITAPFLDPLDNIFNVGINTAVPEPSSITLVLVASMGSGITTWRRWRKNRASPALNESTAI